MVINAVQNKEGRKIESTRRQQIATLNRLFWEDDAEQRREEDMGANSPGRRNRKSKGPEECLCSRNSKEACGWNRAKGLLENLEQKCIMLHQTVAAMMRINCRETKVELLRPARKLLAWARELGCRW